MKERKRAYTLALLEPMNEPQKLSVDQSNLLFGYTSDDDRHHTRGLDSEQISQRKCSIIIDNRSNIYNHQIIENADIVKLTPSKRIKPKLVKAIDELRQDTLGMALF